MFSLFKKSFSITTGILAGICAVSTVLEIVKNVVATKNENENE